MRPFVVLLSLVLILPFAAGKGRAADDLRLAAPQALQDSGLLQYVLPRFSLKTGVHVEVVSEHAQADLVLTNQDAGTAVFQGPNATWSLMVVTENEGTARLSDWLTGKIGKRTITSFEVDGSAPFSLPRSRKAKVAAVSFEGDAVLGKALSVDLCGRCHVVDPGERMNDIGSTPSFFVLRAMRDWDRRFQTFYANNPHPAFTQVEDVTPAFPIDRPSPIIPVEMTLGDLEAILAYVSAMEPADLGAPLQHQ
ncbi:hypothetical protein [Roseovarius sp. MMSF_3281]|uniref:hypothetical protein n=1 Tax=Roseovarius sp. MMSF_3281 TaxID=3046694 RepID=UPI00273EA893|nr:hypothetical protein [Roseovarius sp. MMSF_3281]